MHLLKLYPQFLPESTFPRTGLSGLWTGKDKLPDSDKTRKQHLNALDRFEHFKTNYQTETTLECTRQVGQFFNILRHHQLTSIQSVECEYRTSPVKTSAVVEWSNIQIPSEYWTSFWTFWTNGILVANFLSDIQLASSLPIRNPMEGVFL